jgi:hypothetical protein
MLIRMSLRMVGALVAAFCATAPLSGQASETAAAARHRNDCRLAAQVLRTGNPAGRRDWALGQISSCEAEGPVVLAEQWRGIAPGGPQLERLVRATWRIRDRRIYQQLRETAEDPSRPAAMRVGAMLVLARYVDPASALWLSDLVPPDSIRRIPLLAATTTSYAQLTGPEPLPGPIGASVLDVLEGIASARSTEPREVWYAAAVLARRVREDIKIGRSL